MGKIISSILVLVLLFSCIEKKETPKVIYEKPVTEEKKPTQKVVSTLKVADLPVHIDGTKYLLHPMGEVRITEQERTLESSSTSVSYRVSNYDPFELTGELQNIGFQHIDSLKSYTLTDKIIHIQSVTYLKKVADKHKKQFLLYVLADNDTNKDGKTNANDIKCLYISTINGKNFKKLSTNFQELLDWEYIEATNTVYFRTIEDTNKNGSFDNADRLFYQLINLHKPELTVETYNPFKN